jgi:UDP-glucuronate 4-epimerase
VVLVTGSVGFIGFCLARRLLEDGRAVVGVDNVNSYCDPALKVVRLAVLRQYEFHLSSRLDLSAEEGQSALTSGANSQ